MNRVNSEKMIMSSTTNTLLLWIWNKVIYLCVSGLTTKDVHIKLRITSSSEVYSLIYRSKHRLHTGSGNVVLQYNLMVASYPIISMHGQLSGRNWVTHYHFIARIEMRSHSYLVYLTTYVCYISLNDLKETKANRRLITIPWDDPGIIYKPNHVTWVLIS